MGHIPVLCQIGFAEELAQQHAVGHVLDDGLLGRAVLESNAVADLVPELGVELVRHTCRHTHGSDATRLRAADLHALGGVAVLVQILRNLRRLARARLADDDEDLVIAHGLQKLLAVVVDGQCLAVSQDLLVLAHGLGGSRWRLAEKQRRQVGSIVAADQSRLDEGDRVIEQQLVLLLLGPLLAFLGADRQVAGCNLHEPQRRVSNNEPMNE